MEKYSPEPEDDPRLVKLSEYIQSKIGKEYPLVDVTLGNADDVYFLSVVRQGTGNFIGYASFDTFEELEAYLLEEKYKHWFDVGENTNKKNFGLTDGGISKN